MTHPPGRHAGVRQHRGGRQWLGRWQRPLQRPSAGVAVQQRRFGPGAPFGPAGRQPRRRAWEPGADGRRGPAGSTRQGAVVVGRPRHWRHLGRAVRQQYGPGLGMGSAAGGGGPRVEQPAGEPRMSMRHVHACMHACGTVQAARASGQSFRMDGLLSGHRCPAPAPLRCGCNPAHLHPCALLGDRRPPLTTRGQRRTPRRRSDTGTAPRARVLPRPARPPAAQPAGCRRGVSSARARGCWALRRWVVVGRDRFGGPACGHACTHAVACMCSRGRRAQWAGQDRTRHPKTLILLCAARRSNAWQHLARPLLVKPLVLRLRRGPRSALLAQGAVLRLAAGGSLQHHLRPLRSCFAVGRRELFCGWQRLAAGGSTTSDPLAAMRKTTAPACPTCPALFGS